MADCSLLTRELLAQLVGFDTTSRNSNLDLIGFIEDYLARHGIASTRIDHEPERKTNLLATMAPGSRAARCSRATDVVPVDGQDWASDPFILDERDGRLYGRGSADMKGFVAVALAMVPRFLEAGLKRPIHLAFSCDEEMGCLGVRPLIRHMARALPRPAAVIIGEPTSMRVVNAHKTIHTYHTEVTGLEAGSSNTHLGVNAVMVAGELLAEINRLAAEMRERGDPTGRFDPPFTTVHVGTVEGGTVKNIVPRRCGFAWEARFIPGADTGEVPARTKQRRKRCCRPCTPSAPTPASPRAAPSKCPASRPTTTYPPRRSLSPCRAATARVLCPMPPRAGFSKRRAIPPLSGPGSIDQAHKPDEYSRWTSSPCARPSCSGLRSPWPHERMRVPSGSTRGPAASRAGRRSPMISISYAASGSAMPGLR